MNAVEAMQALVDGKKVRDVNWKNPDTYLALVDGCARVGGPAYPRDGQIYVPNWSHTFELYQEPNPHAKGSFLWAREENRRGHKVTANVPEARDVYRPGNLDHPAESVCIAELESTKWTVVS